MSPADKINFSPDPNKASVADTTSSLGPITSNITPSLLLKSISTDSPDGHTEKKQHHIKWFDNLFKTLQLQSDKTIVLAFTTNV